MAEGGRDYNKWTKESLIKRVKRLEDELERAEPNNPALPGVAALGNPGTAEASTLIGKKQRQKDRRKIDPSRYSTRFIALKLAYLGKNYNGFEYQASAALPTIEEELWKALVKSCLIFPDKPEEVNFAPWEYSKCGRTDRGVSAFGQVITIRVRSNRPPAGGDDMVRDHDKPAWDPIADEVHYCRILNRLLPPDIRVMAWCPDPPKDFSARFSCRERQYRYFFTQPALAPMPSKLEGAKPEGRTKDGWLDIGAMREAAKKFEGLHDFRNFCKIDPGKQITNFVRRMFEADIVEVEDVHSTLPFIRRSEFRPAGFPDVPHPKVYYFHVRGSAFLWHQIRHMVAVIFAVGQGLEPPSIVSDLLDVRRHPRKPNYNMADEVPLVLWDCIFPDLDDPRLKGSYHDEEAFEGHLEDSIDWVWLGEDTPLTQHGSFGVVDQLWEHWREKKMDEILANRLLDKVSTRPNLERKLFPGQQKLSGSQRVFEGGNAAKYVGRYVRLLEKPLLPSPEETNDKWAQSKGFASAEEMTKTKNWRSAIRAAKDASRAAVSGTGPSGGDRPMKEQEEVPSSSS